ncbi:MAG: DUF4263 domain-containing protein [Planctomycetes bacterium]|nr:DUF4263 domain-containing protein [Planctomycetota bacterium]
MSKPVRVSREEIVKDDPLGEFHVWWDDVSAGHVERFKRALDNATREADLQRALEAEPMLLVQNLTGGHGRWVIPLQRLGAEYVTDFVVGQKDSMGFSWTAIELESPLVPMFTKQGDPSHQLTHAIRQVQDWRTWLKTNQNYAARSRAENGLGLTHISPSLEGLILIGRRVALDEATNPRRRQMCEDLNIQIHTYDWLVEISTTRAEWATSFRERQRG